MAEQFSEYITLERDERLVCVRYSRGDGLNAYSHQGMRELTEVARMLGADTQSSAIVLTAEGRFSAGADLKDPARAEIQDMTLLERRHALRAGPDMCAAWAALEQITIVAIEGFCIGGGVALSVACDHRVAGEGAVFRLPEVPLGMNMSWQSNPRLVVLMGPSRAKLFTILGEKLTASEAADWGLVDKVVPDGAAESEAMALAARYGALPPIALRMSKQGIDVAANALGHATSFMDRDQFALAATSSDQKEAIAAFLEKRDPAFRGD